MMKSAFLKLFIYSFDNANANPNSLLTTKTMTIHKTRLIDSCILLKLECVNNDRLQLVIVMLLIPVGSGRPSQALL